MTDTCDCWQDENGTWIMGPLCDEEEKRTWGEMFRKMPGLLEQISNVNRFHSSYKSRKIEDIDPL